MASNCHRYFIFFFLTFNCLNEINEFILFKGREKMQNLGMLPLQYGFSEDYDESVNPSVLNEFATAAFRFGHSLIQGKVELVLN